MRTAIEPSKLTAFLLGDQLTARLARQRGYDAYQRQAYDCAVRQLEAAVALDASNAAGWLGLARARQRLGRMTGATEAARRARELAPADPRALELLGNLLLRQERSDELREVLTELEGGTGSDERSVLEVAADLATRSGDSEGARRFVRHLGELGVSEPERRFHEAERLFKAGAANAADALMSEHPRPPIDKHLRYLCATGRARRAFEELPDNTDDPVLLREVANGLSRQGWLEEALTLFDKSLELDPHDVAARSGRARTRGELLALQGRWSRPSSRHRFRTGDGNRNSGRVLHIVGRSLPYAPVGYAFRTHRIALAQQAVGLEPTVVTQLGFPTDSPDTPRTHVLDGVRYERLRDEGATPPSHASERLERSLEPLESIVQRLRPAVVHAASDYVNAELALELGRRFDVPVVYEVRGFWEETWRSNQSDPAAARESGRYRGRREAERRCMAAADAVVTLGGTMKDHVAAVAPGQSIHVIPNAADPQQFTPGPRARWLAEQLGVADDETVVGYVSTLVDYEGVDVLIDALLELRRRGAGTRGLIVGDGPTRPALENRIRAANAEKLVTLVGRVPSDEVPEYYRLMDLFVVPRKNQTVCELVTPLKPLEAMAAGVPTVVSDLPALRELIGSERGRCFAPEDPNALADSIEDLLNSPETRASLGSAAREWVKEQRTWSNIGKHYHRLYEELGAT